MIGIYIHIIEMGIQGVRWVNNLPNLANEEDAG